jgi:hypothetical protein
MTKTIVIDFCPQWATDTQEAINEANKITKEGGAVELRPDTNLIQADCLGLLTTFGFAYSASRNIFVKLKK